MNTTRDTTRVPTPAPGFARTSWFILDPTTQQRARFALPLEQETPMRFVFRTPWLPGAPMSAIYDGRSHRLASLPPRPTWSAERRSSAVRNAPRTPSFPGLHNIRADADTKSHHSSGVTVLLAARRTVRPMSTPDAANRIATGHMPGRRSARDRADVTPMSSIANPRSAARSILLFDRRHDFSDVIERAARDVAPLMCVTAVEDALTSIRRGGLVGLIAVGVDADIQPLLHEIRVCSSRLLPALVVTPGTSRSRKCSVDPQELRAFILKVALFSAGFAAHQSHVVAEYVTSQEFSPAETMLVIAAISGDRQEEIVKKRGITVETYKKHVRSILVKAAERSLDELRCRVWQIILRAGG
jgi:hypothetical protein